MKLILISFALLVCHGESGKVKRGLTEDAEEIWDHIYDGIETIHDSALKEIHPWATSLEAKVGEALDEMMDSAETRRQDGGHDSTSPSPSNPVDALPSLFKHAFRRPLNPFSLFGINRRNWWEGENVCIERKVIDEGLNSTKTSKEDEEKDRKEEGKPPRFFMDFSMTSCKDLDNLHECTTTVNKYGQKKTVILRHECCHGHVRHEGDDSGCTKVDMKDLKTTIENLGASEFLTLLRSTDLDLENENLTLFVPDNDAVEDFRHDIEGINSLETGGESIKYKTKNTKRRKRSTITVMEAPPLSDIVKGHILDGFVDSSDIHDEDVLTSKYKDSKLRMTVYNTYPKRTWMANCAKITSKNNYAVNGVVHTIDRVVSPAVNTIAQLIESDPQFETLRRLLSSVEESDDIIKALRKDEGQLTLFAPTNAAFDKLEPRIKNKLRLGNGCARDILKHHILPNVICSGVIEAKARTVNSLHKYLMLDREENGDLTVEGKTVNVKDITALNGVVHVIDEFLIPESAKYIEDVLKDANLKTFKKYLSEANMMEGLDAMDNVTIFAPTDRAFEALPSKFFSDKSKLKDFLSYHIARGKKCQCEFKNGDLLDSGIKEKQLRINTYENSGAFLLGLPSPKISTVQCGRIVKKESETCGGIVHKVDRVLFPPPGDLMHILHSEDKYSQFLKLLEDGQVDLSKGFYTLFLPTNSAFDAMPQEAKEKLSYNTTYWAEKIVKKHITEDITCCSGIGPANIFLDVSGKRTLGKEVISLRKSVGGHIYADNAEVRTCDVMATNGVVHIINEVLLPKEMGVRSSSRRDPLSSLLNSKLFN